MHNKSTIIVIILLIIMAVFFTASIYRLFPYIRTIFKYDDIGGVDDTDTFVINTGKSGCESVDLMYLVGAQFGINEVNDSLRKQ